MGYSLDDLDESPKCIISAPSMSDEALQIAKDYDGLDMFGRKMVRDVINNEKTRMEEQETFMQPEPEQKVIPLYTSPAAAGFASPVMGNDFIPLQLGNADPQGATFAVQIQGNSMEPWIKDGSHVFCNNDPLTDGDVGIFAVDGETLCKQYHYDRML